MSHIFISYSKKDIVFARHLRGLLEAERFVVWMDEEHLSSGNQWWTEIEKNIDTCAAFLIIMSPNAKKSKWVQKETTLAINLEKTIFPILLAGSPLSIVIDIHYSDMQRGVKAALPADLLEQLHAIVPILPVPDQKQIPSQTASKASRTISTFLTWGTTLFVITLIAIAIIFNRDQHHDQKTPVGMATDPPLKTPTLTQTHETTSIPKPTITPSSTNTPTLTPNTPTEPPALAQRVFSPECQGLLTPRLIISEQGCVIDTKSNGIRVYPDGLEIIGRIPSNGIFNVISGPKCSIGTDTVWWEVEYAGITGWTAEGSGNIYWLAPMPCPGVNTGPVPVIDGTILEVTQAGSDLNARKLPSITAESIERLYVGDRVLWKNKKFEDDNFTWYEVELSDGRLAYIAYNSDWVVPRDPGQTTPNIMSGATIHITLAGDQMYLLPRPDIKAMEITKLSYNDTLTIINGPVYADFYLWWEMRLPDGRTGWAVDVPGWLEVR